MGNSIGTSALAVFVWCVALWVGFLIGRREHRQETRLAVFKARARARMLAAVLSAGDRWLIPEVRQDMRENAERMVSELEGVAL